MKKILSRKARIKEKISFYKNFKPCGKCRLHCDENSISCKVCCKVYHCECLKFSKKVYNELKSRDVFICSADCINIQLPFYDKDDIDFLGALFGEGLYPCKKCKRDCLDNMNCISCSACGVWLHASCTKLTEEEFKNNVYFFCCKKCENSVSLPIPNASNQSETTVPLPETDVAKTKKKRFKKFKSNEKVSVFDHFLDVKCSHLDPNLLNDTYLANNPSELVIFHTNIRSLQANFHLVEEIFLNCDKLPNILAVTETRSIKDSYLPPIKGYSYEYENSICTLNGVGGVGLYISNEIEYTVRKDLSLDYEACESLWLDITPKSDNSTASKKTKENFVVGVVYRHPRDDYTEFSNSLCKSLHILNSSKTNYVIVGDFNVNTLKYNLVNNVTDYVNAIGSYGTNLFIDKPTRVTDHSATCLDHVYSNLPACDLDNHIVLSDATDHYSTITKVKQAVKINKKEAIYRRKTNLTEQEWENFNNELGAILTEKISCSVDSDANYIATVISNTYQKLLDKYMPLKKLSRKERRYFYKPWITSAIKVSIRKKNKLFIKSKRNKDPVYAQEYKTYRNMLTRTKRNAYENYYRDKIARYGQDKSKTWKFINEISKRKRNSKTSIKSIIDANGNQLESASGIANCLNKHFSSIGKTMASQFDSDSTDPMEYITEETNRTLSYLLNTNVAEIRKLISELNQKKSCGFDHISNKVLKASCDIISPFLVTLFNKCMTSGVFPDCYKVAKVTPLFKGGDRQDINSQRPISLLPSLGKLLEKIISTRILDHFNELNLFSEHQFGFREGFTTEFAIQDIYEKLINNIDNGLTSCAIFLDLAKAFDSVSHDILLRKLQKYGIRGSAHHLLKSYLNKRSQFVSVNNVFSSLEIIDFGVPQGSILGPLLFLVYINDLPKATNFFIKLYADDTFLCAQNENEKQLESEVNFELDKVYKWLAANKLTLNTKKSKFMILSRKKQSFDDMSIKINGTDLEICDTYKYLGVYFDKDLNWKSHIQYIGKKISKACGAITKLRNCVNIETLREVYHALIHSYLRYGIITWGTASETVLKPLQTLVNRAIRIICFAPLGRIDIDPLFEILGFLNIEDVYALEVGKFIYKREYNLLPVPMANYFEMRTVPQHGYNLRSNQNTRLPEMRYRTNIAETSIQKRGNELWALIPEHVRTSESLNSFKGKYKLWLLENNMS